MEKKHTHQNRIEAFFVQSQHIKGKYLGLLQGKSVFSHGPVPSKA